MPSSPVMDYQLSSPGFNDLHKDMFMLRSSVTVCLLLLLSSSLPADGPADNHADNVRQIPPPGIDVPQEDREQLEQGLKELQDLIGKLRMRRDARTPQLLPDVEIFQRAIQQALEFNELYSANEIKQAHEVLKEGISRAKQLLEGKAPWTEQTGLVVRGYRSKLDGTVQPYGLVIPASYAISGIQQHRCDLWFHGRGERTLETQFIAQRMRSAGQYQPADTFVLHPYGRYSNAFKFAGEVDVWEALDHAQQNYRIDADRVSVRGFSMGGAGCWQFAVHSPDRFFAANPGAGFSETPEFLKSFQGETLNPPWYEERLWMMYDCPFWVENLRLVPTIAYSGEIDKQKQAADVMAAACAAKGMNLLHIIGPETAHKIHPDSASEIERRMALLAKAPRRSSYLEALFNQEAVTCTLRYNSFGAVQIQGLDEHWKMSRVRTLPGGSANGTPFLMRLDTQGVNDLVINFDSGQLNYAPFKAQAFVLVNQQLVAVPHPPTDGSWNFRLHRDGEEWKAGAPVDEKSLRKQPGLQGPIDDAFMDSFLFVTPSGTAAHPAVEKWVQSELEHATTHWRQQMRGDARIRKDSELIDEDIAQHNLILWGDPQSNSILARVLPQLPLTWTKDSLKIGETSYAADGHAPVLIYPNPLNPQKYVVLNSGFTYREYDYLNNARQTPKLPDWAVIDLSVPPNSRWPGKVVGANFFDERWQVKAAQ